MTQETLERIRPYRADEETRARYPDVDFDPQQASGPRLRKLEEAVDRHGRETGLLLALIFSGQRTRDVVLIMRRLIQHYRQELERSQYEGRREVARMDVNGVRSLVYKLCPEADTLSYLPSEAAAGARPPASAEGDPGRAAVLRVLPNEAFADLAIARTRNVTRTAHFIALVQLLVDARAVDLEEASKGYFLEPLIAYLPKDNPRVARSVNRLAELIRERVRPPVEEGE